MSPSSLTILLPAFQPPLGVLHPDAFNGTYRVGGGEALVWLLAVGAVITLVCLIIRLISRLQHRSRYNSHSSLFRGLCRTHGLDYRARSLLKQVARHRELDYPARLFTEPKWLDPHSLHGRLRHRAAEVAFLRSHLFT
jgi:hypothetical protein